VCVTVLVDVVVVVCVGVSLTPLLPRDCVVENKKASTTATTAIPQQQHVYGVLISLPW
jgi:hypothetical protein